MEEERAHHPGNVENREFSLLSGLELMTTGVVDDVLTN